jgi:hypothetical protein
VTTLSPAAAIDIIASHGGDPARWPRDVRAAIMALAGSDADVAAALAQAQALDAALADWLAAPVPAMAAVDVAAITARPREAVAVGAPRRLAGWRPALLAASLTMVLATAGWLAMPGAPGSPPPNASARSPSAVAEADETALVFAQVFTPTAAEEDLI